MKKITISRCGARLKNSKEEKKVVLKEAECKSCNTTETIKRNRSKKNTFTNFYKEVISDE